MSKNTQGSGSVFNASGSVGASSGIYTSVAASNHAHATWQIAEPYNYTIDGDCIIHGTLTVKEEDSYIDLIDEIKLMKSILMENPDFKRMYEEEMLVRKLKGK